MKHFFLLLLIAVVVSDQWTSFKFQYKKAYRSDIEESYHKSCFIQNLQLIARKNAESKEISYGITKFADLCRDDLRRITQRFAPPERSGRAPNTNPRREVEKTKIQPFDWRERGAVTNVKDEGSCGSTWAFAAAENMEGQWFLAGHGLYNLSVQQLVSCTFDAQGCSGGYPYLAQQYAINHGITSADIYPYTSGTTQKSGICEQAKVKQPVAKFRSLIDTFQDEEQMLTWTYKNGPLSVAIDATDLYFYTSGIISSCPEAVNHCVVLVGYGIEPNGTSYWIAKNQWGTDWGERGYLRLKYGNNACNLTTMPSSALV
eukprot:NODE_4716_length_1125_cov_48.094810_g4181_i0.p1 GENE.NODE_4716_length_1125_cov_48.094810_g4181_i0~~NODE_4716_length_1125_cov_48.094810_g4181_i0.p1  ORF type:complete len:316 (+),score=32.16 NODE_4716_length_1125_cov_48.094810_g4181_i0:62-1009(+)